jgi:hypothetical protein
VVKGVDQAQSLIEKLLRFFILGRYGMMQVAKACHQRCGLRGHSMALRHRANRQNKECEAGKDYKKQAGTSPL